MAHTEDMRVYVSVDMEGVAGVVDFRQVLRGSHEFVRSAALMAGEANAAVAGAFDGGATRVVVNDAHGDMRNISPADLDERAELVAGSPKVPFGMMQGVEEGFDAAVFIGYHAAAGTQDAILDHAFSSAVVYELRVNGEPWGECDINAALAGAFGVPVSLVSGDDKVCAQAAKRIAGVRTVAVKHGLGRTHARSVHPARARQAIRESVASAVRYPNEPLTCEGPLTLEMDFMYTTMAELASMMPGTQRTGARTVRYTAQDVPQLARCRFVWTSLAGAGLQG